MSTPTHPLDLHVFRREAKYFSIPTLHYAKTQCLTYPFVVDIETMSNYISETLIDILKLQVWPHPRPYYLDGQHPIFFQCKLPFRVGQYEDEVLCDVTNFGSVCVILGQEWITNRRIHYNRRRTEFIYPWMKKVAPQPTPSLQSVPEVPIVVEPTPLVEPEPDPPQMPELAPMAEPEPIQELEPMVEPEPSVKPESLMEHEPMGEPEPDPTPLPLPDPTPTTELVSSSEPVVEPKSDLDPTPKFVSEFAPEEIKLLHEYLDPFLHPEPDIPAFQPCVGDLLFWWNPYLVTLALFVRSAAVGIHHQLLKVRRCQLLLINSRTSFSHQRRLMRSYFWTYSANGWANPTS